MLLKIQQNGIIIISKIQKLSIKNKRENMEKSPEHVILIEEEGDTTPAARGIKRKLYDSPTADSTPLADLVLSFYTYDYAKMRDLVKQDAIPRPKIPEPFNRQSNLG
jgi:hypothetical protein